MRKQKISDFNLIYPGGAGGHWLCYLIHCLNTNTPDTTPPPLNYSNYPKGNIVPCHGASGDWPVDYVKDISKNILFSSGHLFNFYLNTSTKLSDQYKNGNFCDEFNHLSNRACWQFSDEFSTMFLTNIDIHYDLIFKDKSKFTQQLFTILDRYNISYTKNQQIVSDCIDKFKQTCPNPIDHFDNFNSIIWLGYCSGILYKEGISANINYSNCIMEDVVYSFLPHREYFIDYIHKHKLSLCY